MSEEKEILTDFLDVSKPTGSPRHRAAEQKSPSCIEGLFLIESFTVNADMAELADAQGFSFWCAKRMWWNWQTRKV